MRAHAPRVVAMAQRILEDLDALMAIETAMAAEHPDATFGVSRTDGIDTVRRFFDGLKTNAGYLS
jgi:hypothetical protein